MDKNSGNPTGNLKESRESAALREQIAKAQAEIAEAQGEPNKAVAAAAQDVAVVSTAEVIQGATKRPTQVLTVRKYALRLSDETVSVEIAVEHSTTGDKGVWGPERFTTVIVAKDVPIKTAVLEWLTKQPTLIVHQNRLRKMSLRDAKAHNEKPVIYGEKARVEATMDPEKLAARLGSEGIAALLAAAKKAGLV